MKVENTMMKFIVFSTFTYWCFCFVDKDSVEAKMKRLEAQYAAFQIASLVNRYGVDQVTVHFIFTGFSLILCVEGERGVFKPK